MSRGPWGLAPRPPRTPARRPVETPLRRQIRRLFPEVDDGLSASEQLDELIADALLDDTWPDDPDHDERNCRECLDGAR